MANRLSDDELRRSLQYLGEVVGPITATTRNVWEKKLISLRKSHRPVSAGLNAFSSDDSEIEGADKSRVRKKRNSTSGHRPSVPATQSKRLSLSRTREIFSETTDVFKKPSPVPLRSPGHGKKNAYEGSILRANLDTRVKLKKNHQGSFSGNAFDVETSDSDLDSEGQSTPSPRTLRMRKKPSPPNALSDVFKQASMRSSQSSDDNSSAEVSGNLSSYDPKWTIDSHLNHSSHTFYVGSADHKQDSYSSNGYLSNILTNGDFHEEKVQGLSTNYSHCVSWMLVMGTVAFFVVIGALYMTEVQKSSQTSHEKDTVSKFCKGIKLELCEHVLEISRELHNLLSTVAGEYECGIGNRKSRNLSLADAKLAVQKKLFIQENLEEPVSKSFQMQNFDLLFSETISLIKRNSDWGIKLHSYSASAGLVSESEMGYDLELSALESLQAVKPFWCRVTQSIRWTGAKLFVLFLGVVLTFAIFLGVKLWKKRKDAQEKLFYELIEKVIDILQDSKESPYASDSSAGPYKVVNHVRDMLISPKERKEKQWLWDKVECFIEENESRVRVEYENIANENCKIWRWLSTPSPQAEGGKQGKVWQGQAFNSPSKGKNATYSPTPCLKIRNMFDPEVPTAHHGMAVDRLGYNAEIDASWSGQREYGTDWQVSVQDAILEKCEGNTGIVHVAVDTSTSEGCVYMLCTSSEAAGNAFNALHGWWFDGKLVTVKYLRLERYLERYPGAEHCREPLKPSNNKRLSLSTPFFSSALERS